jgi:hypothetical protein
MARIKKMQSGGKSSLGMKSVKAGFDKNPGVTRADIIVAAKKEAKYGKKIKKAQDGKKTTKVALRSGQLKRLGKLSAKNPDKAEQVGGKMVERATRRQRGKEYIKKNAPVFIPEVPTVEGKRGVKVKKKARSGASLSPSSSNVSRRLSSYPKTIGKAQLGGLFGKKGGSCGTPRGAERKAARQARRAVRNPRFAMGGKMKSCRGGCY